MPEPQATHFNDAANDARALLWRQYKSCQRDAADFVRSAEDYFEAIRSVELENQKEIAKLSAEAEKRCPVIGDKQFREDITAKIDQLNQKADFRSIWLLELMECVQHLISPETRLGDLNIKPANHQITLDPTDSTPFPRTVPMDEAYGTEFIFEFPYESNMFFVTRCVTCSQHRFNCNPLTNPGSIYPHWRGRAHDKAEKVDIDDILNHRIVLGIGSPDTYPVD